MEIVQEYPITSVGNFQVNLPANYQILEATTIGTSSKLRAIIDPSLPTTPITFNVVAVGGSLGGTSRTRIWYGSVVLGQQTCDVILVIG